MKKLKKILLPFLLISTFTFSGCEDKNNKVLLSFGDVHASESRELESGTDFVNIIDSKDNFIVTVYANSCGCWSKFRPVMNKYIKDNQALCYRISAEKVNQISSVDKETYHIPFFSESITTFLIYENGSIKKSINTEKNSDIMYDDTNFSKFMKENVNLPICYYITTDDVSTIKSSGKNAVIYFARSKCGDCKRINPGILRDYLKEHLSSNRLYVVDLQPYWRAESDPEYETIYLKTKKDLGLAEETNPTFGYQKGVFPYFSLIENGTYTSGCVIYNDELSKIDEKYFVSNSYYTDERNASLDYTNTVLKGKEIPINNVSSYGEYYFLDYDYADNWYKPILNSFLDYSLPKVTFTF